MMAMATRKAFLVLLIVVNTQCQESLDAVDLLFTQSHPKIFPTSVSPPALTSLSGNESEIPVLENGGKMDLGNQTEEEGEGDEASSYIASPLCIQLHPGLEVITRGIDISKFDLTEDGGDIGTVGKIFDYACSMGGKRTIRISELNTLEYSVPDHFTLIPQTATKFLNIPSSANVIYSMRKLTDEFNVKLSDDSPLPVGAFAESDKYRSFEQALSNNSQFLVTMKATASVFTVVAESPKEVLSRRFKSAYNRLPMQYANDPIAVQNFVKSYGTHYFEKVTFGGMIYFVSKVNNALRELLPEATINQYATNSFKKILESKGVHKYVFNDETEIFKQYSKTRTYFFGGEMNALTADKYDDWKDSLTAKPHPLSVVVKPITDLMPEGSKKDAVKEAINIYLGKMYLEDLLRILNSATYRQSNTAADATYYMFQIAKHLDFETLRPDEIWTLGKEIERWAFTPEWFLENVQLAMKITSYSSLECSMPETFVPINARSPIPVSDFKCSTFIKGLEMRLKAVGETETGFNPAHFIISNKINPYRITFRLSPLAYRNARVPAWARLLRFCTYATGLIRCIRLDETSYYDRSYDDFQVAVKTTL